jgi:hypothetical protein
LQDNNEIQEDSNQVEEDQFGGVLDKRKSLREAMLHTTELNSQVQVKKRKSATKGKYAQSTRVLPSEADNLQDMNPEMDKAILKQNYARERTQQESQEEQKEE